jgi:hypothetical protein
MLRNFMALIYAKSFYWAPFSKDQDPDKIRIRRTASNHPVWQVGSYIATVKNVFEKYFFGCEYKVDKTNKSINFGKKLVERETMFHLPE